jgi:hypothetical protein
VALLDARLALQVRGLQCVPLRRWVLTCPCELRARLGFDAPVLGEMSATVNDCILRFYERALQPRVTLLPALDGAPERRRKLLDPSYNASRSAWVRQRPGPTPSDPWQTASRRRILQPCHW